MRVIRRVNIKIGVLKVKNNSFLKFDVQLDLQLIGSSPDIYCVPVPVLPK